ncbi:hypothetical protein [Streptomyces avermitilis]|uniref:hypothetical protein n=1 Tax=Streptomyces avermitilis TaxID=33903 RepID=UPI003821208A
MLALLAVSQLLMPLFGTWMMYAGAALAAAALALTVFVAQKAGIQTATDTDAA